MPAMSKPQKPVFILGNPRSGTSLLGRMINCHPNIAVPYEAHIYNTFWLFNQRYEPLSDPARQRRLALDMMSLRVNRFWENPPRIEHVLEAVERESFHGVFEALMTSWLKSRNKPRWGEKTPQNGPHWRAISEGFPDAQFIHLVRDGRDCALSWINANFGPKLTYPAAVKWAAYVDDMQVMKQTLGPQRVIEVRYEDLISDIDTTLHAICEFLGEPYDPAMKAFYKSEDTYMTERRNNEKLKQPVMTSNTDKWKKKMSERNQRIFEALAGKQLQRYGYPRLYPDATAGAWDRLRDTKLLHPPLRAMAMIKNIKGWGDSFAVQRAKWRLKLARQSINGLLILSDSALLQLIIQEGYLT